MPTPKTDALARGMELMEVKGSELPPLALDYRQVLCRRVGMSMEVCLTAFVAYAQMVERLPCADSMYDIQSYPDGMAWWKKKGYDLATGKVPST
jgi:hypothetical protein